MNYVEEAPADVRCEDCQEWSEDWEVTTEPNGSLTYRCKGCHEEYLFRKEEGLLDEYNEYE